MSGFRIALWTDANNSIVGDMYLDESGQPEIVGDSIEDSDSYSLMIVQRVWCRLQVEVGEWYLDQRQGTPWYSRVLTKGVTSSTVSRLVRRVVLDTPGVESVEEISVTLNKTARTATITMAGTTDIGSSFSTDILDRPFVVGVGVGNGR